MGETKANASYLTPSPAILKWITKTHILLYEKTGGWLGSAIWQRGEAGHGLLRTMNVLLLSTVGRKSGLTRKVALPYFQYEERVFVIASNAASEKNPDWYENLAATPEARVQLGAAKLRVTARPLSGDEYERLWRVHVAAWPRWSLYATQTTRRIPMVELTFHG